MDHLSQDLWGVLVRFFDGTSRQTRTISKACRFLHNLFNEHLFTIWSFGWTTQQIHWDQRLAFLLHQPNIEKRIRQLVINSENVRVSGQQMDSLLRLKNLKRFMFYNSSDDLLWRLSQFANLEVLEIPGRSDQLEWDGSLLANLTNLKSLSLSRLKSTNNTLFPLQNLTKLQSLELSSVRIRDVDLEDLKNMTNLEHLILSSIMEVTNDGLSHLSHLNSLCSLKLRLTLISSTFSISLLDYLTDLSLTTCPQVDKAGIQHLSSLVSLTSLSLTECFSLSSDGFDFLLHLTNLRSLDLSSNTLEKTTLESLSNLQQLSVLDISQSQPLWDISPLEHLHNLDTLICTYITTFGGQGLSRLKNLSNLTKVDLSHCVLYLEAEVVSLFQIPKLEYLVLRGVDVSLRPITRLDSLSPMLTSINISESRAVSDDDIEAITGTFPKLKFLHFKTCPLTTSSSLEYLHRLKSLVSVSFYGTPERFPFDEVKRQFSGLQCGGVILDEFPSQEQQQLREVLC